MAKKKSDKAKLINDGVVVVKRTFEPLIQDYEKEKIPDYIKDIDHTAKLDDDEYKALLDDAEKELNELVRDLETSRKGLVIVFQGRDASGKSGATERILEAIDYDPRLFLWVPIGAPNDVELQHPYLWRFMVENRMPSWGQMRVF